MLGSIPTAYLTLKTKGIDITATGTGNVGAMNSFEVSNSKIIGLFVFFGDAIKGLLSVYIPLLFLPYSFEYPALALLFAILSHCYNPWIGFRGGRGLATALGGTLIIAPFIPAIWILTWIFSYLVKRDILLGNILANCISLLACLSFPVFFYRYSFPKPESLSALVFFSAAFLIIIFIKHIDPMLELLTKLNLIKRTK
jgi:glycerol-3-phosphate acyltransferase PlsY